MRAFTRRHAGLFSIVAFLILAAFIAATTVTAVLDSSFGAMPIADPELGAPALQSGVEDAVPGTPARVTPAPSPSRAPPPARARRPSRSTLPFAVVGTLVATRPDWSLASVEDMRTRRTRSVMIGDALDDARVVSIERSRVLLERGEGLEFIDLSKPSTPPTPAAIAPVRVSASSGPPPATHPPQARAPGGTAALAPSLKQTQPGEYTVSRDDVDRVTGSMMQLGMDARIVPAFKDGAASGFKLMQIRPGSLYASLGLQSGDVLSRVNGMSLDDPGKLLELYQRLRESPRLDVELERNGARLNQTIRIDP